MYGLPHKSYTAQRLENILFSKVMHAVPCRRVSFFSGQASPGLYGYMYPHTDEINLNDNMGEGYGEFEKRGVEVHETLHQFNHQSDEYDTRRWTEAKLTALDPHSLPYLLNENLNFSIPPDGFISHRIISP